MGIIQNALEKIKTERDISEATYNNYRRYTLYIYRLVKNKSKQEIKSLKDIDDTDWLDKEETIDQLIASVKTKNSLRGYLNTLNVLLMTIDEDKYADMIKRLRGEIHLINNQQINSLKYQLKNDKEEKNWVTWKQVKDLHKEMTSRWTLIKKKKLPLNEEDLDFLKNYVVFSFYVLNKPRRISDYSNLKFVDERIDQFPEESDIKLIDLIGTDPTLTKFNYLVRTEDSKFYFVFNQYKTKHIYGTGQRIDLTYNLSRVITHWLKVNRDRFREFFYQRESALDLPYVFLTKIGRPLKHQQIGLILNKIFKDKYGKNVSASMLRHSYVTNYLKYSRPLYDREQVAKAMAHSLQIQEQTYRKLEDKQAEKNRKIQQSIKIPKA